MLLAASAEGEATPGWHPVPHPWVYMIWTTMHVPSITLPVFKGPHGLADRRSVDREGITTIGGSSTSRAGFTGS